MKKKYKVAPEVRQELLNRIKNDGLSVAQAAKDAGVSETTVNAFCTLVTPSGVEKSRPGNSHWGGRIARQ
jgi:transposase